MRAGAGVGGGGYLCVKALCDRHRELAELRGVIRNLFDSYFGR